MEYDRSPELVSYKITLATTIVSTEYCENVRDSRLVLPVIMEITDLFHASVYGFYDGYPLEIHMAKQKA